MLANLLEFLTPVERRFGEGTAGTGSEKDLHHLHQ